MQKNLLTFLLHIKNLITQIVGNNLVSTKIFLSYADMILLDIEVEYYLKLSYHLIFAVTPFYTLSYRHSQFLGNCRISKTAVSVCLPWHIFCHFSVFGQMLITYANYVLQEVTDRKICQSFIAQEKRSRKIGCVRVECRVSFPASFLSCTLAACMCVCH